MRASVYFAARIAILGWAIMIAGYMVLVTPLMMAPHGFNGQPNSIAANILGVAWLVSSLLQVYLAIRLLRHPTHRIAWLIAIISSFLVLTLFGPIATTLF